MTDWTSEAKKRFRLQKPEHFTNFRHCDECAEHDQTLRNADVDSIGMNELGQPGWDPLCFCSAEGRKYYMPALIRLCNDTLYSEESYLEQFLFHLEGGGADNELVLACSQTQREFIADFLEHLIHHHAEAIERHQFTTDSILRVHEIWLAG